MSNIIGPISFSDWYMMRELKSEIKRMEKDTNPELDYSIAIRKEKGVLKSFLKAYSTQENKLAA